MRTPKKRALHEFGYFENHTRGIGLKLLLAMGFQMGKGLGLHLQGITEPIQPKSHKFGLMGLGFREETGTVETAVEKIDSGEPLVEEQSAGKSEQSDRKSRLVTDLTSLIMPDTCCIDFPNDITDLTNFEVTVRPNEGYYTGWKFILSFQVSASYPLEAPKVRCKPKVNLPTIDFEGNVGLSILRDWTPVRTINDIIIGLDQLFKEANGGSCHP